MGLRGPSFELPQLAKGLAQNAGLVLATYGNPGKIVVTSDRREIEALTAWTGSTEHHPDATTYAMLRPAHGDWPRGLLHVAALGWHDQVFREYDIEIGPAIDSAPPTCRYVSGPIMVHTMSTPHGGGGPPLPGIAITGIEDETGPFVSIDVEYTISAHTHVYRGQDIARAHQGHVLVALHEGFDVKRIKITNVIGRTRELVPPFPQGTPPDGPFFMRS